MIQIPGRASRLSASFSGVLISNPGQDPDFNDHTFSQLKGKAVPLQTWSGPEGSRKLSFPD